MTERSDALANKRKILDAARAVFAEKGTAAEIKDIAAGAGVGVGTIYRGFTDKNGLMAELLEEAIGETNAAYAAADDLDDHVEALVLALSSTFEAMGRYGWVLEALFSGQLPPAFAERLGEADQGTKLRRIIERGMRTGALRRDLDLDVATGMLTGTMMPWNLSAIVDGRGPAEAARLVVSQFLVGASSEEAKKRA